jgi:hypothetical protein
MRASGSLGFSQSSFDALFFRFLSSLARSSRVGVSMPLSAASRVRERVVTLARVAADDAAHRRVGLQRGGVDAHRLALQQTRFGQTLEHPGEHGVVRLQVDEASRSADRRVVGNVVGQRVAQEVTQSQRIAPRARRSPVPSRCPRSSRSASAGSRPQAPATDDPSAPRRTCGRPPRRIRRNRADPGSR